MTGKIVFSNQCSSINLHEMLDLGLGMLMPSMDEPCIWVHDKPERGNSRGTGALADQADLGAIKIMTARPHSKTLIALQP